MKSRLRARWWSPVLVVAVVGLSSGRGVGAVYTGVDEVATGNQSAASQAATRGPVTPAPNGGLTAPRALPRDYIIGPDDILNVLFATAKDMSMEVLVRPDGKITLPVLGDIPAAGMTPTQLAVAVEQVATKFVRDAAATVIVKAVNSRKFYVIGEVNRQGGFPLGADMTVLHAIGEAGGFFEGADKDKIIIVRNEGGKEIRFKFNYGEVLDGKNLQQNIRLLPGDIVLVK